MATQNITQNITKTFTYPIPDDYLAQTSVLGKTATWTYEGPDHVWLFMNKDDNTYIGRWLLSEHDAHEYPCGEHEYLVKLDCEAEPLLATLLHDPIGKPDYASLKQRSETLPDGTTYTRPHDDNMPPDHAYDAELITYNPTTQSWNKPLPWKQPHSTWHDLRHWRNALLDLNDNKIHDYMPAELKAKYQEYHQALKDLPQIHGATDHVDAEIDLTATAPINTEGNNVIKVSTVEGVEEGMGLDMVSHLMPDLFDHKTYVVSIDVPTKTVILNDPLVLTPTANNKSIRFLSIPDTHPHKISGPIHPDHPDEPLIGHDRGEPDPNPDMGHVWPDGH